MKALIGAGLLFAVSLGQLEAGEATPSGTAMTFYLLANQGRCAEARQLFTPESITIINKTLGSQNGFAEFCAGKGQSSPLIALSVRSAKVDAERATVEIARTYEQGVAYETDRLVKQGPTWKIVVGPAI